MVFLSVERPMFLGFNFLHKVAIFLDSDLAYKEHRSHSPERTSRITLSYSLYKDIELETNAQEDYKEKEEKKYAKENGHWSQIVYISTLYCSPLSTLHPFVQIQKDIIRDPCGVEPATECASIPWISKQQQINYYKQFQKELAKKHTQRDETWY